MIALGKLPNVIAKVSAAYGGWSGGRADGEWSIELQKETMLHTIRCFPDDRLVFGTDWPPSFGAGVTAAAFIDATRKLVVKEFGVAFARKLFLENPARVYGVQM